MDVGYYCISLHHTHLIDFPYENSVIRIVFFYGLFIIG